MIYLILIVIIIFIFSPYIDVFKDYRGKQHLIIWYNNIFNDKREYYQVF